MTVTDRHGAGPARPPGPSPEAAARRVRLEQDFAEQAERLLAGYQRSFDGEWEWQPDTDGRPGHGTAWPAYATSAEAAAAAGRHQASLLSARAERQRLAVRETALGRELAGLCDDLARTWPWQRRQRGPLTEEISAREEAAARVRNDGDYAGYLVIEAQVDVRDAQLAG
jgi:hypothetical protein